MKRLITAVLLLWPTVACATEYLTVDDTTKSFLAELVGCSGPSNAVTYDATAKAFGCNSIAGGPGGTNTASNLGGGLANYDSASGTDLRFNTFWSTDFDLSANLFKIDDTKWATDAEVAAAHDYYVLHVTPTAFTGAAIAAAITSCGTDSCQIDLAQGTYTDVCLTITRDYGTAIIGRGEGTGTRGTGETILKPYDDPQDCEDISAEGGALIQIDGADNVVLAHFEADGRKDFKAPVDPITCGANQCGAAIRESDAGADDSRNVWIHDVYVHHFIGNGLESRRSNHWVVEHNRFEHFTCYQPGATESSCGCGAGDPGDCRGWDLEADATAVAGLKTTGNAVVFENSARNFIVRNNIIADSPGHPELEAFSGGSDACGPAQTSCPSNFQYVDNEITGSLVLNGAQQGLIARNRITDPGLGSEGGDYGTGILITAASHWDITIRDNFIYDSGGSPIVVKPSGPGGFLVEGNSTLGNCTHHANGASIWIWGHNVGSYPPPRDIVVRNNIVDDDGACGEALQSESGGDELWTGDVQFLGGSYDGDVVIDNPDVKVRGLEIDGDLTFGATAHGFATGLDVTGSTTNTGTVCLTENDSTPMPDSCISNLANITVGAGNPPGTCTQYDYYGQTATTIRNCLCVAANTWQCSTAAAP